MQRWRWSHWRRPALPNADPPILAATSQKNSRSKNEMKRRHFLRAAGGCLAVAAIAKPAIAQSSPEVKWRLTSSFPKSLDTLYGAAEVFSKAVAEATDNKIQFQSFAT